MNSGKLGFKDIVHWDNDEAIHNKWICEISPSDTTGADAEFICKAVNSHDELVRALEAMVDWYNNSPIQHESVDDGCKAIAVLKQARAALQQVKGGE